MTRRLWFLASLTGCVLSSFSVFAQPPTITSISSSSGVVGMQVLINGSGFGTSQGTSAIALNGTSAIPASWSDASIAVIVPSGATSGPFSVMVGGQSAYSSNFSVTALPSGWLDLDVGSVGTAGSATYANGTFTVSGAGSQIFGAADAFHFVYLPASGDGSIVARLVSVQGGSGWAAVGAMIRETLAAGSTNMTLAEWPVYGPFYLDTRTTTDGSTSQPGSISGTLPYWVKLVRSGSTFTSYGSPDGVNWTQVGSSQTITMATNVEVGLAVDSGSTSSLVTATFDNVSVSSSWQGSTPSISALTPTLGSPGTSVLITGTNFGVTQGSSTISFNGTAGTPTNWSATSISVPVPEGATTGNVVVTVGGVVSNGALFTVSETPTIESLSPTSGPVGTSVTITGENFGSTQGTSSVTFSGQPATTIASWSAASIVVTVPSGATTGNVVVNVSGINSNGVSFTVLPTPNITTVSPGSAAVGASVTIAGANFGSTQGTSTVTFSGSAATTVATWNAASIVATVPTGAITGSVVVTVGGVASNGVEFTVEPPPAISVVSPTSGTGGTVVTVTGSGFGATQSSSTVAFDGVPAAVNSWNDTQIVAMVPATRTGAVTVTVGGLVATGPTFQLNTVAILTNSLGNQTTYVSTMIEGAWVLLSAQGPGCSTCSVRNNVQNTYDSNGNLLTTTDANGNTVTYTYDSNNNVLSKTAQLNGAAVTTSYTYNGFGEVLTLTDPLGNTTNNTYDAHGNLTSVMSPPPNGNTPSSITQFAYNNLGELTQITDPNNNVTQLTYNPVGLIGTITDAQQNTTSYAYDGRGNRTSVVDPINGSAHPTTFSYDIRNRLTGITYPDGTSVGFGYDYRGRRISAMDQNNHTTTYAYDDADRLVSVTDAASNVTQYGYDTEGNLTSITDANNHTTQFSYDAFGRVIQTTFPSSLIETYGYDLVGNLTSKTDRKGQTIQYVYDALYRLTNKIYPDSTSANYVYDLVGKIQQVSDPTGAYGFAYDNMGRLIGTSTQYSFLPGVNFQNAYTYDAASNRQSLTAPDGSITTYGYDSLNRLNGLANSWAGSFAFGYDALSRRTSLTRPNGVSTSYSYDAVSHLLSVLHQAGVNTLDGASYTYDGAGNRTSKTNYLNGVTSNYGYDPLYELTQVTQGGGTTESYSYDAVGNRLSSSGVPTYSYNSSNELTSNSSGSFTYDANGNTLSDPSGKQYTWDFENRLTQAVVPGTNGGMTTFAYDPFGRRIQKSGPLGTTNYLYDGMDSSANVIDEVNNAGNVLGAFALGPGIDRPLAESIAGAASYYEQDGLGSVTSLSSAAGALANTYAYDSYGRLTASTGTLTNPFQFTGRDFDAETQLNFYRARYYDDSVGRFVNEDPSEFEGDNDFYAYVRNNPVVWIDPLGLVQCTYDIAAHHLHCVSNDGNQNYDTSRARSGRGMCMNNMACVQKTNQGPIPPGRYGMGPMGGTPNPHKVPRVWLTPLSGTITFDRKYFEVHQGNDNSSAGCIVLDPDEYHRFQGFYATDNSGTMGVQ